MVLGGDYIAASCYRQQGHESRPFFVN